MNAQHLFHDPLAPKTPEVVYKGLDITEVSGIGNYYGGLAVVMYHGRYYWSIKDEGAVYWWHEIPKELYTLIIDIERDKHGEA